MKSVMMLIMHGKKIGKAIAIFVGINVRVVSWMRGASKIGMTGPNR